MMKQSPEIDPQDIEIVARALPGRGEALRRIIQAARAIDTSRRITHTAIAAAIAVSPSTIRHWICERHWPRPATLIDLLRYLRIERAHLAIAAGILSGVEIAEAERAGDISAHVSSDPAMISRAYVLSLVREQGGDDEIQQRGVIFDLFIPHCLAGLGLKASGLKGGEAVDAAAAKVLLAEWREWRREERLSRERAVSPSASSAQADIVEQAMRAREELEAELSDPEDEPEPGPQDVVV